MQGAVPSAGRRLEVLPETLGPGRENGSHGTLYLIAVTAVSRMCFFCGSNPNHDFHYVV
jgi:hypothetical protein